MKGGMLQVFRREEKEGERGNECSLWDFREVLYVLFSKADIPILLMRKCKETVTCRVCISLYL